MKKQLTAAIAGTHIRYDVPSKCTVVHRVLSKTYKSKKHQNDTIAQIALELEVNPVTIKSWVSKYHNTFSLGMKLPRGTMAHAFTAIPESSISSVNNSLRSIRNAIIDLKMSNEVSTIDSHTADDLRTTATPKQILNELIEGKKQI